MFLSKEILDLNPYDYFNKTNKKLLIGKKIKVRNLFIN